MTSKNIKNSTPNCNKVVIEKSKKQKAKYELIRDWSKSIGGGGPEQRGGGS